jgi:hypothetical protein
VKRHGYVESKRADKLDGRYHLRQGKLYARNFVSESTVMYSSDSYTRYWDGPEGFVSGVIMIDDTIVAHPEFVVLLDKVYCDRPLNDIWLF